MNLLRRSAVLSLHSVLPSPAAVARYHCSPTCTGVGPDEPPQLASRRAARDAAVNVPIALIKVASSRRLSPAARSASPQEPERGLEPLTSCLQDRCSTN